MSMSFRFEFFEDFVHFRFECEDFLCLSESIYKLKNRNGAKEKALKMAENDGWTIRDKSCFCKECSKKL